jgi:hypothetical protein
MSVIKVNTIQNANGTTALTIAANGQLSRVNTAIISDGTYSTSANNVVQGSAKAWVNFDASSGSSAPIRGAFNVSSVTWVSTGQYQINYATAMPNANYAVTGTSGYTQGGSGNSVSYLSFRGNLSTAIATTSVTVITSYQNAALQDAGIVCVAVFSS